MGPILHHLARSPEMAPRPLEYCCECDAPTGRAGQGEDRMTEPETFEEAAKMVEKIAANNITQYTDPMDVCTYLASALRARAGQKQSSVIAPNSDTGKK